MTGFLKKFDDNVTMPFKISNKQLFKKSNQIWKKVYGDDDKYIKTKIKIYADSMIINFQRKKCQKKKHHASVYQ